MFNLHFVSKTINANIVMDYSAFVKKILPDFRKKVKKNREMLKL